MYEKNIYGAAPTFDIYIYPQYIERYYKTAVAWPVPGSFSIKTTESYTLTDNKLITDRAEW